MNQTIDTMTLTKGPHAEREAGMCAMEAVAWLAGEPHSDAPQCACPIIARLVINANDNWDDETRNRLLKPLLHKIIGTRVTCDAAGDSILLKRMYMVQDWHIRVRTPAFLRLAGLKAVAESLEALAPVIDAASLKDCEPATSAARSVAMSAAKSAAWSAAKSAAKSAWSAAKSAAWSAAEDAAWSATWSAAEDAARSAAEDAARSAAWSAAKSAAWSATWSAAKSAAWSAAEDAARSATWSAFADTVREVQESFAQLLSDLCDVN